MTLPFANDANETEPQHTRWSLVAQLHEGDDRSRLKALDDLLQRYLPVLEWYLQRHPGLDQHRREDLIQSFVASKIIENSILTQADPARGRFRTFLLNAFQNHIRDEVRRSTAARRTPPGGPLRRLDEADGTAANDPDMDQQLRQAWISQMVAMAIKSMQAECEANQREDVWAVFSSRLLAPLLEGAVAEPYGELVKRLGLASPSQAANLLITAKRMFSRHLHVVALETVEDPAQAEQELQELKNCL